MKQTEKSVLKELIEKYQRSVLSKEGSKKNLRIVLHLEKEFPFYFDFENFEQAQIFEENLREYEEKNWITATRREADGRTIDVKLNLDKVDEICDALHISTENMTSARYATLMKKYRHQGIDWYIDDVLRQISDYKSIRKYVMSDLKMQENLLKSLCAMMKLEDDVLERIFSAEVLGNSKTFEKLRSKVIWILKQYSLCAKDEDAHEILAQYHIVRNPGHLILKGRGVIRLRESILHIEDFSSGLTLSSMDIQQADILEIRDTSIMTVENLTSFYQCGRPDTLIIYLGGYHNTVRREFLKQLYVKYPDLFYLHFGDIDAGGFYILEHLKTRTGIPFQPYKMDISTLREYRKQALPLTKNDRARLKKLKKNPMCSQTVSYMLDNNIKLEQEQVSPESSVNSQKRK